MLSVPLSVALRVVLAAAAVALVPATALAHPAHLGHHPGLPGAKPLFDAPFPAMGPSAGGHSSENVEFVKNFPQHTDSAGARKVGDHFYITTERDLTIYDVTTPADPVQVGRLLLPEPGTPVFTEEDPDTNGRILLVSNGGVLLVIDVSDKTAPKLLSTLADADDHTITCVLDCTWAYGSEGTIVDLRNPAAPKLSPSTWTTDDIESEHDVTEVSPGMLVTSTQPLKLLDARTDPEHPKVTASTPKEPGRFTHANLWPRGGEDDFLLVGGEAVGPGCSEDVSASFSTWDAREWRETGTIKQLDEFRLKPGLVTEGRAPESSYCVHWFDEHPYYRNGGLVAIGWYEHGTHFLKIGDDGKIAEVGWFVGGGGQSSAAYWIDERTVYVADYIRGLDVLTFTGDIGSKPAEDEQVGVEDRPKQAPPPTQDQAPGQQTQAQAAQVQAAQTQPEAQSARSSSPAASCVADGLRSVSARGRGAALELSFSRVAPTPVTVEVFQQSVGRRVVGERLVARFTGRTDDVAWNGKANRPGREVVDGYYFVRYRTAAGSTTRRIALRRSGGRWSTRPSFHRAASCDLLRSFKVERPVFDRSLGIAYQVEREARVTVTVLRGARVVKRFDARQAGSRRTHRLRFDGSGQPRGEYRVRIEASRAGEQDVVATAVSRRL